MANYNLEAHHCQQNGSTKTAFFVSSRRKKYFALKILKAYEVFIIKFFYVMFSMEWKCSHFKSCKFCGIQSCLTDLRNIDKLFVSVH